MGSPVHTSYQLREGPSEVSFHFISGPSLKKMLNPHERENFLGVPLAHGLNLPPKFGADSTIEMRIHFSAIPVYASRASFRPLTVDLQKESIATTGAVSSNSFFTIQVLLMATNKKDHESWAAKAEATLNPDQLQRAIGKEGREVYIELGFVFLDLRQPGHRQCHEITFNVSVPDNDFVGLRSVSSLHILRPGVSGCKDFRNFLNRNPGDSVAPQIYGPKSQPNKRPTRRRVRGVARSAIPDDSPDVETMPPFEAATPHPCTLDREAFQRELLQLMNSPTSEQSDLSLQQEEIGAFRADFEDESSSLVGDPPSRATGIDWEKALMSQLRGDY